MRIARLTLGPLELSLSWGEDDDSGGPGDSEAKPMGPVGFAPWAPPDVPALHWWQR